jgi:hypothetical protein
MPAGQQFLSNNRLLEIVDNRKCTTWIHEIVDVHIRILVTNNLIWPKPHNLLPIIDAHIIDMLNETLQKKGMSVTQAHIQQRGRTSDTQLFRLAGRTHPLAGDCRFPPPLPQP